MEDFKDEMMTEEETQALVQKLASLNLEQAAALINSITETEENSEDLCDFIRTHLNEKVALALQDVAMREMVEAGLLKIAYDENGTEIGFVPVLDENGIPLISHDRNEVLAHIESSRASRGKENENE
ncbi:MAG: hypothetical protein IJM68_00940 [Synergistaceae bacterium]|nr:hypothetical protein [Synergistaceae bacterium]